MKMMSVPKAKHESLTHAYHTTAQPEHRICEKD